MTLRRNVSAFVMWVVWSAVPLMADAAEVAGRILRLSGAVAVRRAGQETVAAVDTDIRPRDVVITGQSSRVEVLFADGTSLTLAEATEMAVDAWSFAPAQKDGNLALRLVAGAFAAKAGKIAELPGSPMRVRIPVATIGIRGTHFWAGPMDGQFGVLLIEGGIYVENLSGRVELTEPGNGVFLPPPDPKEIAEMAEEAGGWIGPGAPLARGGSATPPAPWSSDRVTRALATVEFEN